MKNSNKYFTLNFFKKQICGSKKAFAMANKGSGDAYNELMALMSAHPDFKLAVVNAKRNPSQERYKGMDYDFMEDYISFSPDSEARMKKYEAVKEAAAKANESVYPIVKKWFIDEFGVKDAKNKKQFNMKAAIQFVKDKKQEIYQSAEIENELPDVA